jgi:iron complex outermembrane recepter protein
MWGACCVIAAWCLVFAVSADAEDAKYDVHISQSNIGAGLSELARQTHVQLLYPYALAQVPGANPVNGRYSVPEALEVLLKGTGFSGGLTTQGVITISLLRTGCTEEGKALRNKIAQDAKQTASIIALMVGVVSGTVCSAQAATPPASGDAMETVVVTGLKSSLNAGEQIKRQSYNVVDSIVPEDIGKLPDVTVGDALQRITGVQVTRGNDQVTGVNIRGLPNLVTTLNGNEIFTTTGRTFSFQNLPAEVLSGLDVYKTISADQVEGGIAGLVDVRTHRPFDFDGLQVAGSVSGTYGTIAQAYNPNVSLLVSNRWKTGIGEFGALVNVSWKKESYYYPIGWSDTPHDPKSTSLTGLSEPVFVPFVGSSTSSGGREYPEANIALQFRPGDDMEIHFDMLWTGWRSRFTNAYFFSVTSDNLPLSNVTLTDNGCTTLLTSTYGCLIKSATVGGSGGYPYTAASNQAHESMSDDFIGSLGMKYNAGPWLLEAEFSGVSSAYRDRREIVDMSIPDSVTTISDSNYHGHAIWSTSVDATDPSNYYLQSLNESFDISRGSQYAWTGHVTRQFSNFPITSVDIGGRYAFRKATTIGVSGGDVETYYPSGNGTTSALSVFGENFFEYRKGYAGYPSFVMPSTDYLLDNTKTVREAYGAAAELEADPAKTFHDDESSMDFWVKANYDVSLLSIPIDGQFGVRTVTVGRTLRGTETTTIPAVTNEGSSDVVLNGVTYAPGDTIVASYTELTPYNTETRGTDVLPSISARVHVTDDLQLRLAFGKTMTLPNFSALNPATSILPPTVNRQGSGSAGNPDLAPTRSTAYDLSLEYYLPGGGMASIAGFYRDVKGYVESVTETVAYDSDYCTEHSIPQGGSTAQCNVVISTSVSSGKGYIEGYELAVEKFFDFLPGFWSGFGTQLNYTWIQSRAPIAGNDYFADMEGELTNVSKNNYSAVLMYEKYGLSVRLAATYRSKYIESYYPGNDTTPPIDYVNGTTYVDLGVSYNLTPQIMVTASATNLLGEYYSSYSGTPLFPRDVRLVNKSYTLGVHYRLN